MEIILPKESSPCNPFLVLLLMHFQTFGKSFKVIMSPYVKKKKKGLFLAAIFTLPNYSSILRILKVLLI
jgi:hypothetical protein